MHKSFGICLGILAGTMLAVGQDTFDEVNFVEPSNWATNGWYLDNAGYMHEDSTTGTMWPVQLAELGDDPTITTAATVDLANEIDDRHWVYAWRQTKVENATHTVNRRLVYEEVPVIDPAYVGINFDGALEGDFAGINSDDQTAFVAAFTAQEDQADINNDGVWDSSDLTAFSTAYLAATGANSGLTTEYRVGYVYDGMWVGIDPTVSMPSTRPYLDNVTQFERVPNLWTCWDTSDVSAQTASTLTTVSSNEDSELLLAPPTDPTAGQWTLLWADIDALAALTNPVYPPLMAQPLVQGDDIINFPNQGSDPVLAIWVNTKYEMTATSWETSRWVPKVGSTTGYRIEEDTGLDQPAYDGSLLDIDELDDAPSTLWDPAMRGTAPLSAADGSEYRSRVFYSNRWGIPTSAQPDESPLDDFFDSDGEADMDEFDGTANRPWTVIPETIDDSSVPSKVHLHHGVLVTGHHDTETLPRYVALSPNPFYQFDLPATADGYNTHSITVWGYVMERPTARDLVLSWTTKLRDQFTHWEDLYQVQNFKRDSIYDSGLTSDYYESITTQTYDWETVVYNIQATTLWQRHRLVPSHMVNWPVNSTVNWLVSGDYLDQRPEYARDFTHVGTQFNGVMQFLSMHEFDVRRQTSSDVSNVHYVQYGSVSSTPIPETTSLWEVLYDNSDGTSAVTFMGESIPAGDKYLAGMAQSHGEYRKVGGPSSKDDEEADKIWYQRFLVPIAFDKETRNWTYVHKWVPIVRYYADGGIYRYPVPQDDITIYPDDGPYPEIVDLTRPVIEARINDDLLEHRSVRYVPIPGLENDPSETVLGIAEGWRGGGDPEIEDDDPVNTKLYPVSPLNKFTNKPRRQNRDPELDIPIPGLGRTGGFDPVDIELDEKSPTAPGLIHPSVSNVDGLIDYPRGPAYPTKSYPDALRDKDFTPPDANPNQGIPAIDGFDPSIRGPVPLLRPKQYITPPYSPLLDPDGDFYHTNPVYLQYILGAGPCFDGC